MLPLFNKDQDSTGDQTPKTMAVNLKPTAMKLGLSYVTLVLFSSTIISLKEAAPREAR